MSHRETDIPELHAALTTAASRASRTPAGPRRVLRPRVATALCVIAVALAGVVGVGAATGGPSAPATGPAPALAPSADTGLLRCVLAVVPDALLPGPEAGGDARAC